MCKKNLHFEFEFEKWGKKCWSFEAKKESKLITAVRWVKFICFCTHWKCVARQFFSAVHSVSVINLNKLDSVLWNAIKSYAGHFFAALLLLSDFIKSNTIHFKSVKMDVFHFVPHTHSYKSNERWMKEAERGTKDKIKSKAAVDMKCSNVSQYYYYSQLFSRWSMLYGCQSFNMWYSIEFTSDSSIFSRQTESSTFVLHHL